MKKNIIVRVLVNLIFLFSLLSWAVNTSALTISKDAFLEPIAPIMEFNSTPNDDAIAEVSSIKGILVFSDQSTLDKTLDALSKMDRREREAWEENLNFVSQGTLYNQINDAEILLEEEIYGKYDENLSLTDLNELGVKEQHTTLYENYLRKGMITEIVEKDGSKSFELAVIDPPLADVLNEDGLIIINNSIYQYTSDLVKIFGEKNLEKLDLLKSTVATSMKDNILVINRSENNRSQHSWTKCSGWHYDGDKKRYCLNVYGTSSNSMSLMYSSFYVQAKGEQKKWGIWKLRNTYHPIHSVGGNWSYSFVYTWYNGLLITRHWLPDNDFRSPFYYQVPGSGSNFLQAHLSPNGIWSIASPYFFYDAVNVDHYYFTGSFYGGPHGYSIDLVH